MKELKQSLAVKNVIIKKIIYTISSLYDVYYFGMGFS